LTIGRSLGGEGEGYAQPHHDYGGEIGGGKKGVGNGLNTVVLRENSSLIERKIYMTMWNLVM
jgi:hypothetical protein